MYNTYYLLKFSPYIDTKRNKERSKIRFLSNWLLEFYNLDAKKIFHRISSYFLLIVYYKSFFCHIKLHLSESSTLMLIMRQPILLWMRNTTHISESMTKVLCTFALYVDIFNCCCSIKHCVATLCKEWYFYRQISEYQPSLDVHSCLPCRMFVTVQLTWFVLWISCDQIRLQCV